MEVLVNNVFPKALMHMLPLLSAFGLCHCSRAARIGDDIGFESKPRRYTRDIAGERFPVTT
jgi:hypothetical protein